LLHKDAADQQATKILVTPFYLLKAELPLNNVKEFSTYVSGNISRLRYRAQRVNAVGETVAVYCGNQMEHAEF
jgi:hypothetical protein